MHSSEICVTIDLIVVRRTHRSEEVISIKETNFFLEVIGLIKTESFSMFEHEADNIVSRPAYES